MKPYEIGLIYWAHLCADVEFAWMELDTVDAHTYMLGLLKGMYFGRQEMFEPAIKDVEFLVGILEYKLENNS